MTQISLVDKYHLCTSIEDPFLEDKTIWVAILKSGRYVYQDDNRPNIKEPIAWKRLGSYILESEDSIVGSKTYIFTHIREGNGCDALHQDWIDNFWEWHDGVENDNKAPKDPTRKLDMKYPEW